MSARVHVDPRVTALLASAQGRAIVLDALEQNGDDEAALFALGVAIASARASKLIAAAVSWAEQRPAEHREALVPLLRGAWFAGPLVELERVRALQLADAQLDSLARRYSSSGS